MNGRKVISRLGAGLSVLLAVGCSPEPSLDDAKGESTEALTTVPTGFIDGVSFDSATGKVAIAGWACNPNQTHIQIHLRESHDSNFRYHRSWLANDFSRQGTVTAGFCADVSPWQYGFYIPNIVLSPGTYYFKMKVKGASGYVDAGSVYGPVTVGEAPRTATISNGRLKVRLDKQRGGLLDNIIDVASGAHYLVNDLDGRGMGNSGMRFANKFGELLVVETGSHLRGPWNVNGTWYPTNSPLDWAEDPENQVVGDVGNDKVTTSTGYTGSSPWLWAKAHAVTWDVPGWRNFVYSDMTWQTQTVPTQPAESSIGGNISSGGTAIRFDREVDFTASNLNIIRVKERVRNLSGAPIKPRLQNPTVCPVPGCMQYPWPWTSQIGLNRYQLTKGSTGTVDWYYKSNGVWVKAPALPARNWFVYDPNNSANSDLKWAGAPGVIVGGSGGAAGLRCVDATTGSALTGYFVGDHPGLEIVGLAPYWGNRLAEQGVGAVPGELGGEIPHLGYRMSYCYLALSRTATAVTDVQVALDNATTYSYSNSSTF